MKELKTILVPVDFSDNSREALKYAIDFLGQSGGQITLLYGYKVYSSSGMFISVEKLMKEDAEREMDILMRHFREKLPENISLDNRIIRGEPVDTIVAVAKEDQFDLVIMGTKGAGGIEEVFIGSTTGTVIKRIDVPLIAIPSDCVFQPIQHLVLALDGDDYSSAQVFVTLRSIADKFGTTVEVLHLGDGTEQPLGQISELLEGISCEIVLKTEGSLKEAITQEVQANDSQMIAMVRRSRGFLSSLFHSSATLKTAFDSPVPLLILFD